MKKTKATIGFVPVLAVVLIFLRFTDIISWPWRWVLFLIWGSICLGIFVGIIYFFLYFIKLIRER